MSDQPPHTLIARAKSESGRTHQQKSKKKSRKKSSSTSGRKSKSEDGSKQAVRKSSKTNVDEQRVAHRRSKSREPPKRRDSSFIVTSRTRSVPNRDKSNVRFDGIPCAPPRSQETREQKNIRASLKMFAADSPQDSAHGAGGAYSPGGAPNLNCAPVGAASIMSMPMSILGSLPEPSGASPFVPVKEKTIRLIVRRAYRNRVSKQLYCFDEGRRLIIVSTSISYDELRAECAKAVHKDEVLEVLVNEHGQTRAVKDTRFLCNLDELVAVTAGPPEKTRWPFCGKFIESLNLGRPDHVPLEELDRTSRLASFVQRSSSHLAIAVQKLNATSPVQEQGSVEIRRMSRGWGKVAGKVLDKNRPFFVYPWNQSLMVDAQIMLWMIGLPLAMGFSMAFVPFNRDALGSSIEHHKLYTYFGMTLLGSSTALFMNAWIGFYFFIHMSTMSYMLAALSMPVVAIYLYKWLSKVMFPFYNSPICIMLIMTVLVYGMAYPHMPRRLRMKKDLKKDMGNSMIVMDFLILVFVVNRLLVLNFGQRDAMSLFVLSVMYPLLVTRSTTDCSRLAEAFNRKTVAVVEAFFTFVSSVFQMIVFLAIDAKVKPFLIFIIINITDIGCLLLSGPLIAFFQKKNILLLKKHRLGADDDEMSEGFDVFIRWVKDPLKLKPLLVKCYCETSAKCVFIILTLLIRFGPSNGAYPFVSDVRKQMFTEAVYFTAIELTLWATIQYAVEYYLRWNKCQYMLHKEKKNMLSIATVLGFNNGFITVLLLLQQTPASGA